MTDTLFADVSSFQVPVDNRYPYRFLSFRCNDGTYKDTHFAANLAWAKASVASGRIVGFLVYFVWEPNWQQTVATFKQQVGVPHDKMAVMIDAESWSGRISGNQSIGLNGARESLISWLGGNRERVIGYGNAGDLNSLWPYRGDTKVVLANYSSNPSFPGKIAHQFSSSFLVPPFGYCDINSADGYSPEQFAAALGLSPTYSPPTPVKPSTPSTGLALTGVDRWAAGTTHKPGEALVSGNSTAIFQTDGNFVLYHNGKASWQSRTNGRGATTLNVQPDGNLVIYAGSKPIWYTRTSGKGSPVLILQTSGALTLFNASTQRVLWTHS